MLRRGLEVTGVALRGAPRPFTLGITSALVYAAATVAAAVVLGWVTDHVLLAMIADGRVDRRLLVTAVVAVLGVALAKAGGVAGRRLGAYIAQYALQARYRRQVTRRYLQLPIEWHRRHPTGQLLSNANADVEAAFFIAAPLPMAVGAVVLLVVTAGALMVTDPLLSAVGFSVLPMLVLANLQYQRRMRHAAALAQQARADVSEIAHESFDAALVVKTLGREDAETARFGARSDELRARMTVVGRLRAFFDPVIEALPNVGILLVLLIGAWRVRDGELTAGDLVQFAYLFRLLAIPVRVFGWMLGEMPRAVVGWERIRRVLDADGELPHGTDRLPAGGGVDVAVDGVAYRHPSAGAEAGSRGIDLVDLQVGRGQVVALVGPTGAGKSTLAALLVRLMDPDRGEVRIDGRALPELAADQVPEHVAVVFQDTFLFDGTVRDNITLGEPFSDQEVERAARLAQAHEFVGALDHGYDTLVGERGASLSGGQRQRIALARALVRRPRLLILDDATSAVDAAVEQRILRGLAAAGLESTVVMIAYRRSAIALADEVVYLEEGRVAGRGVHDELFAASPGYRDLVTAYDRERGR
jgi:ATP-binding cassette, subfamily B, bacterial